MSFGFNSRVIHKFQRSTMPNTLLKLILLFGVVHILHCATFPTYFKKCKSKDGLNECIKENIMKNIKSIVENGDKAMKLSNLNPMKVKHLDLQATPDLKIQIDDADFRAFDTTIMKTVDMDFEKKTFNMEFIYGRIEVGGMYDVKGQILVLPISGTGRINMTGVESTTVYEAKLETIDKDGQKYYNAVQDRMTLQPQRVYFKLDNLFNGDERLGTEMNKFLNENWKDVYGEVKGVITDTVRSLTTIVINAYLNNIPISELVE